MRSAFLSVVLASLSLYSAYAIVDRWPETALPAEASITAPAKAAAAIETAASVDVEATVASAAGLAD